MGNWSDRLRTSIGRRKTILIGIGVMIACIVAIFLLPVGTLTTVLTTLPVLGKVPVIGLILMVIGIGWALININSLPMVVDMTDSSRIGTYTGLYYLFSTGQPSPDRSCTGLSSN